MNEPYYFPPDDTLYRSTIVHRLPLSAAPKEPERELTFGRVLFHLLLLGLTILTTSLIGSLLFWSVSSGLLFSFTLLVILGAHEMGHYLACRWYGVRATLPYFIPVPLGIGTFGAFIKIKSAIPTKRALFDIGIAGPLAGFIFAIPAAVVAVYFAQSAPPAPTTGEAPLLHDPPLFLLLSRLLGVPANIELNPIWFAAWVGLLVTSLNLLPVGQLDGGHVIYALFGERGHRRIARVIYLSVVALAAYSYFRGGWLGWIVYAVILTLMLRVGHPPVTDEDEPLGWGRTAVAIIGLIVFLLCFLPFPMTF